MKPRLRKLSKQRTMLARSPPSSVSLLLDETAEYTYIFLGSNGEIARKRLEQGFDMVSIAVDSACLAAEMERQLSLVTGEAGKGDRSYS